MNCYADVKNCVKVVPCLFGCCVFCLYKPLCEMRCTKVIEPDPERLPETCQVKNKDVLVTFNEEIPYGDLYAHLTNLQQGKIRTLTIMKKDRLKKENP